MPEPEKSALGPLLMASACSGTLARFPCHPLDTCKTLLQGTLQKDGSPVFRGVLDVMRRTVQAEGVGGLYRGFGVTALGSAPATCLYITSYESAKVGLGGTGGWLPSPFIHLGSGLLAEAVSCVFWVPIDVTKERLQAQAHGAGGDGAPRYRGSLDALQVIGRTEGLRGLYKGYMATLLSFGPYSALFFAFYVPRALG